MSLGLNPKPGFIFYLRIMRVLRHSKRCMFDKIWHIPLDGDLDAIETQFIQYFRPKLNITGNPDNQPKRRKKTSKPIINSKKKPKTQKQAPKYKLTDLPSILANAPKKSLLKVLSTLTANEKDVIIKRHALFCNEFHTLQEIADQYNLCRERIRQIQRKAERKLLHPLRMKKLFDL